MTDAVGRGAASGQAQRAFILQHALSFSRKQAAPGQTSFSAVLSDTATRAVPAAAAPAVPAATSPTVEKEAVPETAAPSVQPTVAVPGVTGDDSGSTTFSINAFFDRDPTPTKWLTWHMGQIDLFRAAVNSLFPNRTPRPLIPSGTWQPGPQATSTPPTHKT